MVASNDPAKVQLNKPACLLAIDPGLSYTGYGVFEVADVDPKNSVALVAYGLLRGQGKIATHKAVSIWSKVDSLLVWTKPTTFAIETPEFQQGKRGEHAARQGNTLKLSFLVGGIIHGFIVHTQVMKRPPWNLDLPNPNVFRPSEWKGQVTKQIHLKRCNDVFGTKLLSNSTEHNISDALMLGRYVIQREGFNIIKGTGVRKDL